MTVNGLSSRLVRAATRVRSQTGVSLAFAGTALPDGGLLLGEFAGPTAGALPGVTLRRNQGLGGRAVALRRPIAVNDYFASREITHQYDLIIRSEGIRSIAAAPVIVGREPVALLYAAFRTDEIVGDRIRDSLNDEARALEQELVTLQAIRGNENDGDADLSRLRNQVRTAYGELRVLSRSLSDARLQQAIRDIADRLADQRPQARPHALLTARELDVLALASSGFTNRGIAERLGLTLYTVKGYMKSAMCKLNAATRLEAVVTARRTGLLP